MKNLNVTDKTGPVVSIKMVEGIEDEDVMIITRMGNTVRLSLSEINVQGRNTQGVTLIRLRNGDEIASVAKVVEKEEEDTPEEGESDTPTTTEE